MEKFKRQVRNRLIYFRFLLLVPLGLLIAVAVWGSAPNEVNSDIADFSYGAQVGMSAGLAGGIILRMRKYYRATKNVDAMRRLYVAETDERTLAINLRIANTGYFVTLGASFIGSVIAGFFDQEIMIVLLGVGFFMLFLRGVLGIYYGNKL
jgi:predicted DNA repair protein MutK